jgi:hypothetical protein
MHGFSVKQLLTMGVVHLSGLGVIGFGISSLVTG